MIRCAVIEDEPKGVEVITRYISRIEFLDLKASFREPLKAIEWINHEKIELLFLDINLPEVSGLQFLSILKHKPLVIFTTAYPQHAVDSYEIDAVDYLLKPISFERFLKSVSKAQVLINQLNNVSHSESEIIYVKSGGQTHRIHIDEIIYLEKEGNYLTLFLKDKKIVIRENMSDIFNIIPKTDFIRVHKSFVVSIKHLEMIEAHQVTVGKVKIPLGASYREEFLKRLNSNIYIEKPQNT